MKKCMKFRVRFQIGNRYGKGSAYSLRDICVALVDRYSLREAEIAEVVQLGIGQCFINGDMEVQRVA